MERRYQVIMLVTALVIKQSPMLQRLFNGLKAEPPISISIWRSGLRCHLQSIERHSSIAVRHNDKMLQSVFRKLYLQLAHPSVLISNSSFGNKTNLFIS